MNLNRFLAALGAVLVVTSVSAQEKLLKNAIKQGRKADSFYEVENPNYRYTISDFQSLASKNDCILEYTTTRVRRFGDEAVVVDRAYLLPRSELMDFICANLSKPWGGAGLASKTQRGTGWMYYYPDKRSRKESYFFRYDNVYWSGKIDGGLISGTGEGFAYNDTWMVAFKGSFWKGYPSGSILYRWILKRESTDGFHSDKVLEMRCNCGTFHDDMAWFEVKGKYGFINAATQSLLEPKFGPVLKDFKDYFSGKNYAVIKHTDGYEWKVDRDGNIFAYSDEQQKIFDDQKREAELAKAAAEAKAAEERRIAELKAAEERRIAEEQRQIYLQKVQKNMDISKWQRGDRLCLEFGKQGQYITGTLEEWNPDKTKCRIKIVTSPGARIRYNGDNLEKNNYVWIDTKGEGWHKALPEEIEAANRDDNSTYRETHSLVTVRKCPNCDGTGNSSRSSYSYKKCYRCDGTGLIEQTQTF